VCFDAVAFAENSRAEVRLEGGDGATVSALKQGGGKAGQSYPAVAFTCSEQANSFAWERDFYPTLNAQLPNDTSNLQQGVRQGSLVRRLTPRECERLQGYPDDYTAIEYRNKPAADGPRYKALGNSMAVPVMRWILSRIEHLRSPPI
jgi:DNA (cytosine-5)-methyltransferase 1